MPGSDRVGDHADLQRAAESILKKLGFSRVPAVRRSPTAEPAFWVQEAGVPRRTFPVFVPPSVRADATEGVERWVAGLPEERTASSRAIFVVPTDAAAEAAWDRLARSGGSTTIDHEVSILVVPPAARTEESAHFHLRQAEPREILRLATGIVVGLFRRSQASEGASPVDFEELLRLLRGRFGIDVHRSLHVTSDEDALFLLYQLAMRDSYAPGEPGANLHVLVLKPTGPAARLPWFAA